MARLYNIVLVCMAGAILATNFGPVVPQGWAGYVKAAAGTLTGLAALFLHPPAATIPPAAAPAADPKIGQ